LNREGGERDRIFKMSGSGNDFVCIDNRTGQVEAHLREMTVVEFVRALCTPHVSLGADGVILIEPSSTVDFSWRFFNADGSEAEMCGNGGRCAARFAYLKGIAAAEMSFETRAGVIDAYVRGDHVKIRLPLPHGWQWSLAIPLDDRIVTGHFANTGVPHVVVFTDDVAACDVVNLGRAIRYHELFSPAGTNVDFVTMVDAHHLRVRTYERGVENETLACGTGAVASALISSVIRGTSSPVEVTVASGETLRVYFSPHGESFDPVYLEGFAHVICEGALWEEAYRRQTR